MDRIHYAGDSVVTGTEIARALLEYAHVLAEHDMSATVDIPTVSDDGSLSRSTILIGPASQLISDAEESEHDELVDDEVVQKLRHDAEELRRGDVITPVATEDLSQQDGWLDDL
ncbi:hypothetical protein [Herbiconiux sp.]|jgi:hypothetical protein|uniref:hypothetical protein n=1 Tax=Herbiconiux sp. TaxID=1871186 RepID=UPI0025C15512|nr:hypothetical protein [Herbiconiux sp.]